MISQKVADSLAQWLLKDQPGLFVKLAQVARVVPKNTALGDFTDILSAIGSGISTAVSSVGSFLTSAQGLQTLSTLGATYMTTQAQKNALNVQLATTAANKTAAPIQTVYNSQTGQYEALYTTANGQQQVVTSNNAAQFYPTGAIGSQTIAATASGLTQYLPYIAIGGGLLVLMLLMRSRR